MKHLLSLEKLSRADMDRILQQAAVWKKVRGSSHPLPLAGQTWAMLFSKSSTRTRVSFEVGIRELGGQVIFLSASELQLGRGEPIKDTARVLGRMTDGAVIRTFAQSDVEEFALHSGIPTINALTDEEHPCQILADVFTFQEKRGSIQGKVVAFIGDGACNVATSWIFAAAKLGFELRIAAPAKYQSTIQPMRRLDVRLMSGGGDARTNKTRAEVECASGGKIVATQNLEEAAAEADLLYTDVWVSMGKEAESAERVKNLTGYQLNLALLKLAKPNALVMHCLPAYRGKEIDDATFEAHAQTIFDQAENRLHVQKAVLEWAAA